MWTTAQRILCILAVCASCVATTGCILKVTGLGGEAILIALGGSGNNVNANATLGSCAASNTGGEGQFWDCVVIFEDTQHASIILPLPAALVTIGRLFDPVILQVPATVTTMEGTLVQLVSGTVQRHPLTVKLGLPSIAVDANSTLVAEQGMQLAVIDAPDDLAPGDYGVSFRISPPIQTLKIMFAGKVVVSGTTYYPLLLPCTADFAAVPAIPVTANLTLTQLRTFAANVTACDHKVYTFPPPRTVVEFFEPDLDNYFITADPVEQQFVDTGAVGRWQRTGFNFKAGGPAQACRFYGNANVNPATGRIYGPNSHFYTAIDAECNFLKSIFKPDEPSWKFESLDFQTTLPSGMTCPAGTVAVNRAYNNGFARGIDSNHRITTSSDAINEVVARGWINEGVVMCAPQ